MKKLVCRLRSHRWDFRTLVCTRCGKTQERVYMEAMRKRLRSWPQSACNETFDDLSNRVDAMFETRE